MVTSYELRIRRAPCRGISLLEVLIAMFVLLFGLMGVAAIFPVGNYYAGKSEQYDRGSALADAAFSDLKARGLLLPAVQLPNGDYHSVWRYADNSPLIAETGAYKGYFGLNTDAGQAFVIDPLGAAEATGTGANYFPFGATGVSWTLTPPSSDWPIRRLTYAAPGGGTMPPEIAETIFRLHDDLSVALPEKDDLPSMQRWTTDNNGTPNNKFDDVPLARDYVGSYSWLATVLPTTAPTPTSLPTENALAGMQPANARYGSYLYEVSVAIFHKREDIPDFTTERLLEAQLTSDGSLILYSTAGDSPRNDADIVDQAADDIRANQWIAVAGVHPTTGKFLLKWYRLLTIDNETGRVVSPFDNRTPYTGRSAMVSGPAWPQPPTGSPAPVLRAILVPGVIGVTTQTLQLSVEN